VAGSSQTTIEIDMIAFDVNDRKQSSILVIIAITLVLKNILISGR
jgi:hypothetical protein